MDAGANGYAYWACQTIVNPAIPERFSEFSNYLADEWERLGE